MTAPQPLTFPQSHRLKTPAAFDRCYKRKRSASDDVLIVYACENGLPHPRLGCSVSKKVGNAVVRNRARRRLRAAASQILPLLGRPGHDYVLVARASTLTRDYPGLLDDLKAALTQAHQRLGPKDPVS